MKRLLLIIIGLFFQLSYSQPDELSGTWFLKTVSHNNLIYERPEGIESISDTYFSITNNPTMITQTCNMSGGIIGNFDISEEEQEIIFSTFTFFEGSCTETEAIEFQEAFFNFFESSMNSILEYEINNDVIKSLKISDTNGNFVEYTDNLRFPSQEIQENNWYLSEFKLNSISYTIPANEELQYVKAIFLEDTFESNLCSNSFTGYADFYIANSQFYLYNLVTSDLWCEDPENEDFRLKYLNFFFTNSNQGFNYEILENSDSSKSFHITSFDGDYVIYNNTHLGVNDNSKFNISTYPNPVKDKLVIENPDLKITSISISDVSGKIVFSSREINSDKIEVDFSSFPKGVYFLTTELDGKILKTEKVLKK